MIVGFKMGKWRISDSGLFRCVILVFICKNVLFPHSEQDKLCKNTDQFNMDAFRISYVGHGDTRNL
jgi:hypothetical protein